MKMVKIDKVELPALGIGTWKMGDNPSKRREEMESIRYAMDNGVKLIDTAEMYGNGASEELIGETIKGYKREELYIVSKVLPSNAGKNRIMLSCENSLNKLGTEYLDMYLLHWRGTVPFRETIECMERLKSEGKIKNWGVSNMDIDDMKEIMEIPDGKNCKVNQVLYHLGSKGIEFSLKPYTDKNGIVTMAYCPIAQSGSLREGLLTSSSILKVGEKYGITPIQVILSYILGKENTIAIPKAAKLEHMKELLECRNIVLDSEDIEQLEREYPKPIKKEPLDIE